MAKKLGWWCCGVIVLVSLIRMIWNAASGASGFDCGTTAVVCAVHIALLAGLLAIGVIRGKREKEKD